VKSASNPRQAALQGLAKMRELAARGFAQAVLPPQARPNFRLLRRLGFSGTTPTCWPGLPRIAGDPGLRLFGLADVDRERRHGQPVGRHARRPRAFHRRQPEQQAAPRRRARPVDAHAARDVRRTSDRFVVHDAAARYAGFRRRGRGEPHALLRSATAAAASNSSSTGSVEFDPSAPAPRRYPARQTLEASQAIARLHGLPAAGTVFVQQNPDVIDQGVFHNDVIAVGNGNVLFYHQQAFARRAGRPWTRCATRWPANGIELHAVRVDTGMVPVADAVASYLFNSQLLSKPDGRMALVVPHECQRKPRRARYPRRTRAGGRRRSTS
jgi:succinylarginine dihydrolase